MQNSCVNYLERTVRTVPNHVAIQDGDVTYTYVELQKKAWLLAEKIASKESERRMPVAVFLPKSADAIISFMGILYSGNFYVSLDIHTPEIRLEKIINDLQPMAVITLKKYEQTCLSAGVSTEKILFIDALEVHVPTRPTGYMSTLSSDPVYLAYTSGSTGMPKGVVVTHGTIMDYIDWSCAYCQITSEDCFGSQTPFHYVGSDKDIYPCLASGAVLKIIPNELFSFPVQLVDYLKEEKISFISWVPSVLCKIADLDALHDIKGLVVRCVLFTGEPMPVRQLRYWLKHLPCARFLQIYGASEARACMYYELHREIADEDTIPLGFARPNNEVLLLDEHDCLVRDAECIGELCVKGSCLSPGYWRDKEKTAAVFVQNPLQRNFNDRIYRTGDLAMRSKQGEMIYKGRRDNQIEHMGHRIELGEIDAAASSLALFSRVCTLYDEIQKRIILFYESKDGESIQAGVIRKHLLRYLPRHMIPTKFVWESEMPKNSVGKIDRQALRQTMQEIDSP